MLKINEFIDELRNTDSYIRHIYTRGGCYKFHVLLSKIYKGATPYIGRFNDHIRYGHWVLMIRWIGGMDS